MYDSVIEHGSCGIAAAVDLQGENTTDLLRDVLTAAKNHHSRAGITQDADGEIIAADGAGLLFNLNHYEWAQELPEASRKRLHDPHYLQVGQFHFERDLTPTLIEVTRGRIEACFNRAGIKIFGWRDVPVKEDILSEERQSQMPHYQQLLFSTDGIPNPSIASKLFSVSRDINANIPEARIGSLALHRLVYKGLLTGAELKNFFPDFSHLSASAAISHVRFATNVLTQHFLAQPFGSLAHNGEINSITSNRFALEAFARGVQNKFFGGILTKGGSDSCHLDDAVALMLAYNVPLFEALMRLIPPALRTVPHEDMRQFLSASKRVMGSMGMFEGPVGLLAFDGQYLAAHLDRLGLRPLRWLLTEHHSGQRLSFSSEIGAIPFEFQNVVRTGQLGAGDLFGVRLPNGKSEGRIFYTDDIFEEILKNTGLNWKQLSSTNIVIPKNISPSQEKRNISLAVEFVNGLFSSLCGFGWKSRDVEAVIRKIKTGNSPTTSMGLHGPLPILDPDLRRLYDLYQATAAYITNPPFDYIGENDVIEIDTLLGRMAFISAENREYFPIYTEWQLSSPLIPSQVLDEMFSLANTLNPRENNHAHLPKMKRVKTTFAPPDETSAFNLFCSTIEDTVSTIIEHVRNNEIDIVVLSDKTAFSGEPAEFPIPPLLLVQALRTELLNQGLHRNLSIVVESGTIQSGHDIGVLLAHGASGVSPFLIDEIANKSDSPSHALYQAYKSLDEELRKMMAKRGITSIAGWRDSYCFEAVGLAPEVVGKGGGKAGSKIGGLDLRGIFDSFVLPQIQWFRNPDQYFNVSPKEKSVFTPKICNLLYQSAHPSDKELLVSVIKKKLSSELTREAYQEASLQSLQDAIFRMETSGHRTLRDLLNIRYQYQELTPELINHAPLLQEIFQRIFEAHMSLGALGPEAHAGFVRGCKKVGVQTSSGEGGEEKDRRRDGPRALDRSESRQIGTAAWGVDLQYLMEADEICIKIGQGAKPGEGGDLPEAKVTAFIAKIRNVAEGTRLISPPPNHDIYSIEDLQGRIRGLHALNPRTRISVKMPSMPHAGTIAVGAVKAGAQVIEISGYDGGTGAAGEESVQHCGLPVELGISEAHQYLVEAGIRDQVFLRADGGMRTPKDFVKMLLLGADGITLGTLLMMFAGCKACKRCHKGDCLKGITTQDEILRKNLVQDQLSEDDKRLSFKALRERQIQLTADGIERALMSFASEIQKELALLGVEKDRLSEWVGRVDALEQMVTGNERIDSVNISKEILKKVQPPRRSPSLLQKELSEMVKKIDTQALNAKILSDAEQFLNGDTQKLRLEYSTTNTNREIGTPLAGQIYERLIRTGKLTKDHRITLVTKGTAGHNYGFAIGDGITLIHEGFANDSVGQYMSGNSEIIIKVPAEMRHREDHALAGNQLCFGATGGTLYVGGKAGERLGVRNSGAVIVAEGALDYAFEYQTAGRGILLGGFKGVLGSRMTGGDVFVYDQEGTEREKIARDYVHAEEIGDFEETLKAHIEDFARKTESPKAQRILDNWEEEKRHFVRVLPNK